MAEIIALPRRATILNFTPYETKARVNIDYYEDEGTPEDEGFRIEEGKGSTIIVDATTGFSSRNFTISALNLAIGEIYSLRVRRKNETGWGPWSNRFRSIVETDKILLPPNATTGEPLSDTAQPIPFTPDFIGAATIQRDLVEHRMETGQRWRRLKHTSARYSARMKWSGLVTADKNTLVAFLEARLNAIEPFETNDFVHGTRRWFTQRGTIQIEQLAPTVYGVQINADESKALRFWTVGASTVGGPDKIL